MQHFSRARVLLPGGHNGNQVQGAGLVGCESQSRKHENVYDTSRTRMPRHALSRLISKSFSDASPTIFSKHLIIITQMQPRHIRV